MQTGTDIYFSVFKERSNHLRWDRHIAYAEKYPHVTDSERSAWIDALVFLDKELGRKFFIVYGEYHPFSKVIAAKGGWEVDRLVRFTSVMRHIKENGSSYAYFISKIQQVERCVMEAIPFMEVGHCFMGQRFTVNVLKEDPKVTNPDLLLRCSDTDEEIYVEVSKLTDSKAREESFEVYWRMNNLVNRLMAGSWFSGYQLRPDCTETEWNENIAALKQMREDAENEQIHKSYTSRILHVDVFPFEQKIMFDQWIEQNSRRQNFLGMELEIDEPKRIIRDKIATEAKQIRANTTGIVYLLVNDMHYWTKNLESAMLSYSEVLRDFPNVLALVIHSEILDKKEGGVSRGNNYILSIVPIYGPLRKTVLVVRNDSYQGNLSERSIQLLFDCITSLKIA